MTRSQLLLGVVLIALGVLLLADQLGYVSTWVVLARWWPVVLIVAGLAQILTRPRNVVGAIVLVAIGGVLLAWTHGVVTSLAILWPVLLIALGGWLLLRPGVRRRDDSAVAASTRIDVVAIFDDSDVELPAGPLEDGAITTVFGDVDLDLSRTTIPDGQRVVVQATTVFGDVDLIVPARWEITASGPELFGSVRVEPMRVTPDTAAPRLHLRVLTLFGDVEIRRDR